MTRETSEAQGGKGSLAPFRALMPLSGGALLIQIAAGILTVVIPVQMVLAHQAPTLIGAVASSYAAGFLLGCFGCPGVIRSFGYARAFIVFGIIQAVLSLGFMTDDFRLWAIIRFGTGFSGAGATIVIESWISTSASARHRGRMFSIYNVIGRLALIGGQILASHSFFATSAAFLVVACCYALSLAPIGMTVKEGAPTLDMGGIAMGQVWSTAPVAAIGCLYVGMVGSSLISIVPVWGVLLGLPAGAASLLAASVLGGSLLLQWPMGYLSDRIDRRHVIAAATGAATILSLILLVVSGGAMTPLYGLLAMIGGVTLPIYAIAVSHAFDRAKREQAIGFSSSLLFCWALGSVIGPIALTSALEWFGSSGLPVFVLAISVGTFLMTGAVRGARATPDNI